MAAPLTCEYVPLRMLARLGVQIELVQYRESSRAPSMAMRSRCGVALMRPE